MWLAARAEGIGMGWVSLFDATRPAALLMMPEGARPVAVICLGHVKEFYARQMLEQDGWAARQSLDDLVYRDVLGMKEKEQ